MTEYQKAVNAIRDGMKEEEVMVVWYRSPSKRACLRQFEMSEVLSAIERGLDHTKIISLLDGAMEIVGVFEPKSPAQEKWKQEWLEKARKMIDKRYGEPIAHLVKPIIVGKTASTPDYETALTQFD